jgi:hypothetical protein
MTVSYHLVLLVVAIVCAVILTLIGFDVFSSEYALGWLGLTLTFGLASRLP